MASLSDSEFERLQNQLLELKSTNYTLEEKFRKQSVETLQWKEKCDGLEKDLSKYQNLAKLNPLSFAKTFQLNKGQKEKELIESLNEEKELYQKKLENQEKEFKLSNQTLRNEIRNLMNEIKQLKINSKVPKDEQDLQNDNLSDKQSDNSSIRCGSFSNESDGDISMQLPNNRNAKLSFALLSEKEQLETSLDETTKSLNLFKEENQSLNNQFNKLTNHNAKLEQENKQLKEISSRYLNELNNLKEENELNKKELINFKELADKRNQTIDELKCHLEDTSDKAELAVENANKKVNEIRSSLNKELSLLKTEKKDLMVKVEDLQRQLAVSKERINELEVQSKRLNDENKEFKDKLNRLNSIEEENEANKQLIEKLEDEKQQIVLQMHDENEMKLKELNELNESLKEQLIQKDGLVKKLRQDVDDQIEERKIHEKRGVMIVRELKKQLNNEKKIKERLQERLQEKFGELQSEKSFEMGSKSFDTTSVGSWSFLSSSNKDQNVAAKNNSSYSIHSSTDGNTNGFNSPSDFNSTLTNGSTAILEKENNELVSRLTKLQQDKWSLEEKMNTILLTVEKLENDLEVKQKIISHYLMERRQSEPTKQNSSDKFTVKKVVDFIKDKESDNLKEINRKLQRMLEEVLIKNMHLQNNIDLLTNESKS